MACFARKLHYGACDGEERASYFALIEFARKKGGKPTGFALYRRTINYLNTTSQAEMVMLPVAETATEAIERFWPSDAKGTGKEFPGHRSNQWKRTTLWLDFVAAGGGYERFGYEWNNKHGRRFGSWAKVGTPALCSERRKRRKKKPLQVGNISHVLLKHKECLNGLLDMRTGLRTKLYSFEEYEEGSACAYIPKENEEGYALALEALKKMDDEIASVQASISATKDEMRYIVRRMFPEPAGLTPRRALRRARNHAGLLD